MLAQRSPCELDDCSTPLRGDCGKASFEACDGDAPRLKPSPSYSSASTRIPDSESEGDEGFPDGKRHASSTSQDEESDLEQVTALTKACTDPCSNSVADGITRLSDPLDTDNSWFRRSSPVDIAQWQDGGFTTVCKLTQSCYGAVFFLEGKDKHPAAAKVMATEKMLETQSKSVREADAWLSGGEVIMEDPWTEIAVLAYLQRSSLECSFVLKLLGVFQDPVSTYVVTEYCDGGELFDVVVSGNGPSSKEVRRYVWQLLDAVEYLHIHNVGHRDISMENVLLRRGDCVLMDFGQAVRLNAADGTELRYFAKAGKPMYRAPEMYVPRKRSVEITCPSSASPGSIVQVSHEHCRSEFLLPADAIPGQLCSAEPYGYTVAPADIFACGVCAFSLAIGKPPWEVARDNDTMFAFIQRNGVPALLREWGINEKPAGPYEVEGLLEEMLQASPKDRPSIGKCKNSSWLAGAGQE